MLIIASFPSLTYFSADDLLPISWRKWKHEFPQTSLLSLPINIDIHQFLSRKYFSFASSALSPVLILLDFFFVFSLVWVLFCQPISMLKSLPSLHFVNLYFLFKLLIQLFSFPKLLKISSSFIPPSGHLVQYPSFTKLFLSNTSTWLQLQWSFIYQPQTSLQLHACILKLSSHVM